jgi:hypothetical protein
VSTRFSSPSSGVLIVIPEGKFRPLSAPGMDATGLRHVFNTLAHYRNDPRPNGD